MSRATRLGALVALLTVCLACSSGLPSWSSAQERAKAPSVPKWEYEVIVMTPNDGGRAIKDLQKFGSDGFRLVSTTSTPTSAGQGGITYPTTVLVLERAKP